MNARSRLIRTLICVSLTLVHACVDAPTAVDVHRPDVPLLFNVVSGGNLTAEEETALSQAFDKLDRIHVQLFRPGETEPFLDTLVAVQPGQDAYTIDVVVPGEEVDAGEPVEVELTGSGGGVELFAATVNVTVSSGTGAPGAGTDETLITVPVRYVGPGLTGVILDPDGGPAAGVGVELLRGGGVLRSTVTSELGEYLFIDLEPGTYVLRVSTGSGLVSCPAQREIGPLTEASRIVGGFRLSRTGCELRVLVLSGGDVDDTGGVASALGGALPEGRFATDFVIVAPPDLATLLAYDAILLFENGIYEHAKRVGDRIAEYVAAGGNVVMASFYWQNRSDGGFGTSGWGALETLDPFSSTGGAAYGPGSLGTTAHHPITEGVQPFAVDRWWGGVAAKSGTTVVATWADGTPAAGFRTGSGGQRLVAVSAFPGLMGTAGGELTRLFANAVRWAGAAGGPTRTPGPAPRR